MVKKSSGLAESPVKVIGPQLGLPNKKDAILITIALPHLPHIEELLCHLKSADGHQYTPVKSGCLHPRFRNFVFELDELTPDTEYFYKFADKDGNPIDLEGGLTEADCWFYGPDFHDETDKFVLLSCNNPFSDHKKQDSGFHMWERLNKCVSDRKDIRLLIQGGDQVYHDRIEQFSLRRLKDNDDAREDDVQSEIIKNYQHFYANLDYRQLLARIPSAAMLDDHDITDGWGGRSESFKSAGLFKKSDEFKEEWLKFFKLAYSAFEAYQAVKNPEPIYDNAATTYLDIGSNRIFLMDYRKEKNAEKNQLLSQQHEDVVLENIRRTVQRTFILSPVVPVRIDPDLESNLAKGSWAAIHLHKFLGKWLSQDNKLMKVIGAIGSYTDDIYDALASDKNRPYFLRLLAAVSESHKNNQNEFIILSGDIHTGGISEIFVNEGELTIPQIVSSPVAYKPMPKLAKGVTTTESDREIETIFDHLKVKFRNIFFRSKRNFAIITPGQLRNAEGVEFYFEDVGDPVCCPAYFSR